MAGRHSKRSSKAPMVIVIITLAAIIAVGIFALIIFNFTSNNEDIIPTTVKPTTQTIEQTTATTAEQTTAAQSATSEPPTSQSENSTDATAENSKVVVPTQGGQEVRYFNATYVPYKAIDSSTNEECSLREVFGSSFSQGVITFNSDGTFFDSVTSSAVGSGGYAVENDTIAATYSNDKNMSITVTSWDGDTPSELIINYGGYDVYFSM